MNSGDMYHKSSHYWKDLLQLGLTEDGLPWDWTTLGIPGIQGKHTAPIQAQILAKSEGVWAANGLVEALSLLVCQEKLEVTSEISDGDKFRPKQVLVNMKGLPSEILAIERSFLNLAAYVSGIATQTSKIVQKVKQACPKNTPRVALTRKTLPGYRDLAIHGVRIGGGYPHRINLAGGVLIKENHIAAAGTIQRAVEGVRSVAPHGLKIEVEVRSEEELKNAVAAQADGVLLDNFSPKQVQSAIRLLEDFKSSPFVEVSGGLTEENVVSYAIEGVNILSLGSLTHSVKSADLSLLVNSKGR